MLPFVSIIYVKSVHQTRFNCLGENLLYIDSRNSYELIPDGMRVSFCDRSSIVVVHDSCTCGLLFFATKFLLFAETSSFYGTPCPMGIMIKYLNPSTTMISISIRTSAYTHQGNDMPLIDSLREECRRFLRSCFPFLIQFFHAGNDEVLPSSPTGTSCLHCLAFFAIRTCPVGNSGSGYAVLSHKVGNRASVLNVRTNNFSSDIRVVCFSPLLTL